MKLEFTIHLSAVTSWMTVTFHLTFHATLYLHLKECFCPDDRRGCAAVDIRRLQSESQIYHIMISLLADKKETTTDYDKFVQLIT